MHIKCVLHPRERDSFGAHVVSYTQSVNHLLSISAVSVYADRYDAVLLGCSWKYGDNLMSHRILEITALSQIRVILLAVPTVLARGRTAEASTWKGGIVWRSSFVSGEPNLTW